MLGPLDKVEYARAHSTDLGDMRTHGNHVADFLASTALLGITYPPIAVSDPEKGENYC
jgi:hypothetical protein